MSQELFNTSSPRGVKAGANGFCTVAQTVGMARSLEEQLTLLSGYRWVFPTGHQEAGKNPISWAHSKVSSGGKSYSVLSRVCDAGVDYSQRSNRFAHHLVLDASELSTAGPAWVMRQPGIMQSDWKAEPQMLPAGRIVPDGKSPPRICLKWAELTGDAGWAGVLAEAFMQDGGRPAYILFNPGTEILPLIDEAIALLPENHRWRVTFNTYFTDLPAGLTCTWRCCVAGTPAARDAQRFATSGVILDLTKPLGPAPAGRYCEMARTGRVQDFEEAATPSNIILTPRFLQTDIEEAERELLGATNKPTKRLGGTAAAYDLPGGSNTADTSWMPPSNATAIISNEISEESANALDGEQSLGGPHKVFWIVAILWPSLVIAGVIAWHTVTESGDKTKLTATAKQLTDDAAKLTAQMSTLNLTLESRNKDNENLKGELAAAKKATTQSAKERDDAIDRRNLAEKRVKTLAIAKMALKSVTDLWNSTLESVRTPNAATTKQPDDNIIGPTTRPSSRATTEPKSTDSPSQFDETVGDLYNDSWVLAIPSGLGGKPKKIGFECWDPKKAPEHFVVVASSSAEIAVKLKTESPTPKTGNVSPAAGSPDTTLLRFTIDSANRISAKVSHRELFNRELEGWLAMSYLSIETENHKVVKIVKFRLRPQEKPITFTLSKNENATILKFVSCDEQWTSPRTVGAAKLRQLRLASNCSGLL